MPTSKYTEEHVVHGGEANHINIGMEDGSIWEAYVSPMGRLKLKRMIISPPPKMNPVESSPPPSPPSTPKGTPKGTSMGKASGGAGASDKKLDDLINSLKDADDRPPIKLDDSVFRSRLSSIMLDNKYDRRLRGRTRGKLDMKALPKVHTLSRSVFTQKSARKNKAYNICLLVDISGSMASIDKSKRAAEAVIFLLKNFEGLNINVSVVEFNQYIIVLKDWNSKADYMKIDNEIRNLHGDMGAGYNYDYHAINRAYHMFKKAPEGENILIMLSDGQPAECFHAPPTYLDVNGRIEDEKQFEKTLKSPSGKDGFLYRESKAGLHALVKAHPEVTSIGIGIVHGGWQIPNHIVVDNVDELKPQILSVLRQQIKRG